MSRRPHSLLTTLLVGLILVQSTLPLQAGVFSFLRPKPKAASSTVQLLAEHLDDLDDDIEEQGSIVPKQPDIWGEARLTKYRRQYEAVLECQLTKFRETIQARITRSDQAYLATAMVLGSVTSGDGEGGSSSASAVSLVAPGTGVAANADGSNIAKPATAYASLSKDKIDGVALEPTIALDQLSRYLNHLNELRRISDGDDTSDYPGYALHMVRIPVSVLTGDDTKKGHGAEINFTIEPYLSDQLLPDTFRSMVINDLVDQMAFPMTAFLDRDACDGLLKKYFRLLEIERIQRSDEYIRKQEKIRVNEIKIANAIEEARKVAQKSVPIKSSSNGNERQYEKDAQRFTQAASSLVDPTVLGSTSTFNEKLLNYLDARSNVLSQKQRLESVDDAGIYKVLSETSSDQIVTTDDNLEEVQAWREENAKLKSEADDLQDELDELEDSFLNFSLSLSSSRQARMPFPPSLLLDVYGTKEAACVAKQAKALRNEATHANATLLLDVQRFLTEELQAAYQLLTTDRGLCLWQHCTPELVQAIHRKDRALIGQLRECFFADIRAMHLQTVVDDKDHCAPIEHVLAWAVIVESALLNQRLTDSIREVGREKGCPCLCVRGWLPFYLPRAIPTADHFHLPGGGLMQQVIGDFTEATEVFKEFVRCKWPVHVFALDPVTQDQNVGDSFALRREMQMALAIGLAQGEIGLQQFTRYARRIELDMETIGLNRTMVGFTHGADTFGWRFYPRIQTPRIKGNLHVAFNDLLIGADPESHILRDRKLEIGTRECVALVLMPSFVPYARLDSRAHWFELNDPSDRKLDFEESVELSRKIQSLRYLSTQCTADAHLYRDGEVRRLLLAVDQLDRKLPLQTSMIELPYQNVLGGFELLTGGAATLAPEVYGYYGEPGIRIGGDDPDIEAKTPEAVLKELKDNACEQRALYDLEISGGTRVFVVGRNFSVHETVVIAGNRQAPHRLISREVMEVVIPNDALPVESMCGTEKRKFIDVHVATPYGVSNHLLIPAVEDKSEEEEAETAKKLDEVAAKVETISKNLAPVSTFSWTIDGAATELAACVEYETNGRVKDFTLHSDKDMQPSFKHLPGTSDAAADPFRVANDQTAYDAELACWVFAVDADGKRTRLSKPVGPLDIRFDARKGTAQLPKGTTFESDVKQRITTALNSSTNAVKLEIDGYIRFKEASGVLAHSDAQPVRKIGNALVFPLSCPPNTSTTNIITTPASVPCPCEQPLPHYHPLPAPRAIQTPTPVPAPTPAPGRPSQSSARRLRVPTDLYR